MEEKTATPEEAGYGLRAWAPVEKTFDEYVEEYSEKMGPSVKFQLKPQNVMIWSQMVKFGLLLFVAGYLNEKWIDWSDKEQLKCSLYFNVEDGTLCIEEHCYLRHSVGAIFTELAALKAIKIIPVQFFATI